MFATFYKSNYLIHTIYTFWRSIKKFKKEGGYLKNEI